MTSGHVNRIVWRVYAQGKSEAVNMQESHSLQLQYFISIFEKKKKKKTRVAPRHGRNALSSLRAVCEVNKLWNNDIWSSFRDDRLRKQVSLSGLTLIQCPLTELATRVVEICLQSRYTWIVSLLDGSAWLLALTAIVTKKSYLQRIRLCSPVIVNGFFEGTYCLHLRGRKLGQTWNIQ
jgi:hypothetical protein